jgi:hypothetical protein
MGKESVRAELRVSLVAGCKARRALRIANLPRQKRILAVAARYAMHAAGAMGRCKRGSDDRTVLRGSVYV